MNAIGTQLRDTMPDPIAYGGLNKYIGAAAELGRNPISEHRIQPEYGDEQAGAGRNG